ncbi:hypothetical protein TRICI_001646 [Trichomonascus ciferrii]|uniref:Protein PBN1 n=1 Tax=Trichomonascus ciferrii TaxID=44093 RepID=A0A642V8S4_9ASCO|nr:hypothetical protein TRICI_001646 [Trichomonascus ciferrii]
MARQRHAFLLPFATLEDSLANFVFERSKRVILGDFDAPRHDRITIPRAVQPERLKGLLDEDGKFQISWASESNYDKNVPFKVVQEPGLHVISGLDMSWDHVEELVGYLLGSGATAFNQSAYIDTPNWRSYYEPLEAVNVGVDSLLGRYVKPEELRYAKSVFLSYGSQPISPNPNQLASDLVVEIYWDDRRAMKEALGITETVISKVEPDAKVEVGLLTLNPNHNMDSEEFGLSGVIRNLDNKDFEKALFYTDLKHKKAEGSFTAQFEAPLGLHPKHQLSFDSIEMPDRPYCNLYAKYTVPRSLFLDEYQLADLDRSNAASAATGKLIGVWGEKDLEMPVWLTGGWGSEAVVEIYHHDRPRFDFELPMHSRYETPLLNDTTVHHDLPWPIVFWACKDEEEKASPEIRGIGYETFFPENALFYHVIPDTDTLSSSYHIPVAPLDKYPTVNTMTVTVILAGILWILFKTLLNIRR